MLFKLVTFDFDGCFTDGSLRDPQVNAKDTWALKKLQDLGVQTAIITRSKAVKNHLILERIGEVIYSEDKSKTLDILLEKFGLEENEVAYIGDDEPDIPVLKRVGFSAAPADAIPQAKEIVNFVTSSKGGHGAIREFVEFVLKKNERSKKKVVAVVGARSGSERCPNKNGRNFGLDSSLIELKAKELLSCKEVDEVVFTSDSIAYNNSFLRIFENSGKKLRVDLRQQKHASSNMSGREFHLYLSSLVDENDILLYTHPVAPFVKKDQIDEAIKFFKSGDFDRLAAFSSQRDFLFDKGGPLNFPPGSLPKSQDLNEVFVPTFGICLIENSLLKTSGALLGENLHKFILDKIQSIDIDDKFDFVTAKLLNENNIQDMKSLEEYLDKPPVQVLDCTIRDGGYRNEWRFSFEDVAKVYQASSDAGVEWFEAGFRSTLIPGKGTWFYTSEEDLQKLRASYKGKTPAKLAVMFKVGEYSLDDISVDTTIDLFRVLVSHKDFSDEQISIVVETCRKIKTAGKLVGINIPYAHDISPEVVKLFEGLSANGLVPDFVYLADTFGSVSTENIVQKFWFLDEILEQTYGEEFRKIKLGFHAHNNAGDALLKTLYAVDKVHRLAVIDSCFAGLGRGVGNVRTEELLVQLNKRGSKFDSRAVLKTVFELFEEERSRIVYLVAGEKGIHPNKAIEFINKKVCFDEII